MLMSSLTIDKTANTKQSNWVKYTDIQCKSLLTHTTC